MTITHDFIGQSQIVNKFEYIGGGGVMYGGVQVEPV